jgi:TRAP-type C4-dicarboxylate transport system permease small subunit
MRAALDRLFTIAGYLAAVFMVGTLVAVLLGILGRLAGFDVPGADAYAGYATAAVSFLALAYTLRRGEHIRVTLLLHHVTGPVRRAMEIFCYAVAIFLSGALAWFSARLAWQSHQMHDVSQGLDATPLWIPQIAMAVGTALLFLAFFRDFTALLRGEALAADTGSGEPVRTE